MDRSESKPLFRFFCLFFLLYTLLIFPWPGVQELYTGYFCSFARLLFCEQSGDRILKFDTIPPEHRKRTLDISITIANRTQLDATGSGHAVRLDLDSRGIGWIPTALLSALVLATPLPWKRRCRALSLGLLAIHLLIFVALQACIWDISDDTNGLCLIRLSPFYKTVVSGIDETLVTQLGASFVLPFLIWALVTFRRQDIEILRSKMRL